MELSGIEVPEEIVERITEYIPLPVSRRVCKVFDTSTMTTWDREIQRIMDEKPHLRYETAERYLITSRGGTPPYIVPPWTKEDYAYVVPFLMAFAISICLIIYITHPCGY